MNRRPTVYDLQSAKGQRKWLQIHVDNAAEAAAAVEAGIDILSCEPDHHLESIRRAAPNAFVSVGMPHGSVASPTEAIRLGFAMLERGADAVYCSHSPHFIEAMAREAIPVTGHVGLVPNRAAWTGFRAIGRSAAEAMRVLRDVRDIENAGWSDPRLTDTYREAACGRLGRSSDASCTSAGVPSARGRARAVA